MRKGWRLKGTSYESLLHQWAISRHAALMWPLHARDPVLPPNEQPVNEREEVFDRQTTPARGGQWHGFYDYHNGGKAKVVERQQPGYLCRVGNQWNIYMYFKGEESQGFFEMMEE